MQKKTQTEDEIRFVHFPNNSGIEIKCVEIIISFEISCKRISSQIFVSFLYNILSSLFDFVEKKNGVF